MNLNNFLLNLRAVITMPRALNLTNAVLVTTIAWQAGGLGAKVVENEFMQVPVREERFVPPKKVVESKALNFRDFQGIIDQNIFDVKVKEKKKVIEKAPERVQVEIQPLSAGLAQILNNLELQGIYRGQRNYTIIRHKQKRQEEVFSKGDNLFDTGVIIEKIEVRTKPSRIYVRLGEDQGILEFTDEENKKTTVKPLTQPSKRNKRSNVRPKRKNTIASPTKYTKNGKDYFIRSDEVDHELSNFSKLINQARIIPYFNKSSGDHEGYQIKLIDKGSLYDRLGLQNYDVIQSINGDPIDTPEKAFKLLKVLRNEREINVSLLRKGSPVSLNYFINN
ncbi:MAG: hypothetical protein COB67_08370 [SAR324 cluster bacterium]|uniref:PDZ domain-containing protein n=1 Tax=SAR324 cluster bacterium TaxID=2024889 RepID=A0A2A4T1R5_9DELT|nr:MAG: hypothetical protein COB67_08370 [SAR324 cluster bacterium]